VVSAARLTGWSRPSGLHTDVHECWASALRYLSD
jgi:hypothetical protein